MDVNSISKVTLRSRDFARTERFYRELFGWKWLKQFSSKLNLDSERALAWAFAQAARL